jgi:drug/metabolite transporter (DMT)-like permease
LISLGYVLTAILAWVLFGEALNGNRLVGILLICSGVFLIARN